jgi:hypothetical protein
VRTVRSSTRKLAIFMPGRVHGRGRGRGKTGKGLGCGRRGSWTAEPIPVARRAPPRKRSPRQFVRYFYAGAGTEEEKEEEEEAGEGNGGGG